MKRIACIALFAATQALAQSYPSKPVKLLVGVPPVTVHPDGKAHISVPPMDAVALHVGARLLGG